ncbi:hypothetical protein [Geobacter argillaceus]|nr:hypothetical protein [Geobacter argillaceus]
MHVDAIGTAIDLRRPQLHQVEQGFFQAAAPDLILQAHHIAFTASGTTLLYSIRAFMPALFKKYHGVTMKDIP